MDFTTIIQGMQSLLSVENGLLSLGWILALILLWRFLDDKSHTSTKISEARQQNDEDLRKARAEFDRRLEEATDQHAEDLKTAHGKIQELHQYHLTMISDMSEKRISDIKEVVEDYNSMAESTMAALDKLTQAIARPKRRSGTNE